MDFKRSIDIDDDVSLDLASAVSLSQAINEQTASTSDVQTEFSQGF
jgi:hypothetical protein